jgi:hypothetical protein
MMQSCLRISFPFLAPMEHVCPRVSPVWIRQSPPLRKLEIDLRRRKDQSGIDQQDARWCPRPETKLRRLISDFCRGAETYRLIGHKGGAGVGPGRLEPRLAAYQSRFLERRRSYRSGRRQPRASEDRGWQDCSHKSGTASGELG